MSNALIEALRPFALYAEQMEKQWGHSDRSAFYGVKREGAHQITYGDFRRAAEVIKSLDIHVWLVNDIDENNYSAFYSQEDALKFIDADIQKRPFYGGEQYGNRRTRLHYELTEVVVK